MSDLRRLLLNAGFSKWFCRGLNERTDIFGEDGSEQVGYMVIIDDANLLRFVLEDFTKNTRGLQSLCYTHLSVEALREEDEVKEVKDRKTSTVGPGVHVHKALPIYFCYENADIAPIVTSGVHKFVNRAAVVSLQSIEVIQQYLYELQRRNEDEKKLKLYVCSDMCWRQEKVNLRRANTLFLPKIWSEVYNDAKDFFSEETKAWFKQHDIPYIRTYVFHGTPGSGKSSCIKTLASELGSDLYSLNLTIARMDDMALIDMVRDIDPRSVVAIEDIDRIFDNFSVNQTASSVSFSTLLNVMDGTLTKEGIILVLTCNDYQHLDEALKRCGRVSRVFEFPHASTKVMKDMFLSFYPENVKEAETFTKQVKNVSQLPIATLQEFFIRNRKRKATDAIENLDLAFFKRRRQNVSNDLMI